MHEEALPMRCDVCKRAVNGDVVIELNNTMRGEGGEGGKKKKMKE